MKDMEQNVEDRRHIENHIENVELHTTTRLVKEHRKHITDKTWTHKDYRECGEHGEHRTHSHVLTRSMM